MARFDVYRQVSNQIRAIFQDYTPHVEPLALDEAYLDVTDDLKGIGSATRIAEIIRHRIREETGGLTASGNRLNLYVLCRALILGFGGRDLVLGTLSGVVIDRLLVCDYPHVVALGPVLQRRWRHHQRADLITKFQAHVHVLSRVQPVSGIVEKSPSSDVSSCRVYKLILEVDFSFSVVVSPVTQRDPY